MSKRWFVFGMVLCGLTLGVKQTSVYFLAPSAILVNVWVLLLRGLRVSLLGVIGFALAVAVWLLPTIHNAHGWSNYMAGCRAMQLENYRMESVIFQLSAATAPTPGRKTTRPAPPPGWRTTSANRSARRN